MTSVVADPPHAESLAWRVRDAVIWRAGGQLAAQAVQWGATFLVIRILSPRDYGLFAMTQAILVLLNLANGYGLASALIQRRNVTDREVQQLAGMLIALNGGLALVQVAIAPLAAAYYRQPEVAALLRWQALLYLATPFIAVSYARLSRAMDFRRQARATIASALAGAAVALSGALAGLGLWTLVAAPIALFGTRAAMMTAAAGWVRPSFDFRGAGALARFGGVIAASQFFWFLQSQADIFVAGRRFSAHDLGLYSTALLLTQIFASKVLPPINEVAFAAYARLHAAEADTGAAFVASAHWVMAAALPFGFGLAATAEPAVLTVLGPHWLGATALVRIVALATPCLALLALLPPACDARARPGIAVGNGAIGAVILIVAFLIGAKAGPVGLAAGWAAAYPLYCGVALARSLPTIGASATTLATALAPLAAAALAMALIVVALDTRLPPMPAASRLTALVAAGAASYALAVRIASPRLVGEIAAALRRTPPDPR